MRVVVIVLIFTGLLIGCESDSHRYVRERAEFRERIHAIPVGEPVNETNANFLASVYWHRYCSSCGCVFPVRDGGHCWSARVVAGAIPGERPDILIEKVSGQISSRGLPTVTNWNETWPNKTASRP